MAGSPLPPPTEDEEAVRFKGTTPLGRELMRKQLFIFQRKLADAGVKLQKPATGMDR
jgi:hypothetical protein